MQERINTSALRALPYPMLICSIISCSLAIYLIAAVLRVPEAQVQQIDIVLVFECLDLLLAGVAISTINLVMGIRSLSNRCNRTVQLLIGTVIVTSLTMLIFGNALNLFRGKDADSLKVVFGILFALNAAANLFFATGIRSHLLVLSESLDSIFQIKLCVRAKRLGDLYLAVTAILLVIIVYSMAISVFFSEIVVCAGLLLCAVIEFLMFLIIRKSAFAIWRSFFAEVEV